MKYICYECKKLINKKDVIVGYGNMQNVYYHLKCYARSVAPYDGFLSVKKNKLIVNKIIKQLNEGLK